MSRELFSSRWGTALALVGVAVGLGNVWRFPYMMGLFGGGAFLILYLVIVAVFGVPALMAELALGRYTRRGPLTAFSAAGLPAGRFFGGVLCFGVTMAMSYYLVVVGWIFAYVVMTLGNILGLVDDFGPQTFSRLQAQWPVQVLCAALVAMACAEVVGRGVRVGIERVSKVFVPLFAVLMCLLAARSLSLPGAMEGVVYLLSPDWAAITPRAVLAAMGQAFFSLGLGGTFFVIYASYLPDKGSLRKRAFTTAGGDVAASLLAGLAIMPAVFATGLSPDSGPALLFEVVPAACTAMPGGMVFAFAFFVGLGCVAFLSGVAAVEVLVGSLTDTIGWPRRRTAWILCGGLVIVGLPATISLDYLFRSDLIWGSTMQPAGSVVALAALTWGLGRRGTLSQFTSDDGAVPRWANIWFFWVRYVVPLAVITALVSGWIL